MTRKIILDCDPGHDDAIAMILAAGNPAIDLLGITTVGGNQTLSKVTHNTLSVARVARMSDVPVHAGCARPLVREVEVAEGIHGDSGLDGVELPEPISQIGSRHAVDYIIDTIMEHEPGTVTLVPTGPLTNIALAVRKEPRIAERVQEVVLMGGGYHTGNWSATAEFNIIVDPEAAHIVFNEKWPLTMVGLDLTHQALATPEVEEKIKAIGSECSEFVLGLFAFFRKAYKEAGMAEDAGLEQSFRYDGPTPRTREMAVLMLADSVEAASRSLEKATPNRIGEMVDRLLRDKLLDGQLDHCPLTFAELHEIRASFVFSLSNILHGRNPYPRENPLAQPATGAGGAPGGVPEAGEGAGGPGVSG